VVFGSTSRGFESFSFLYQQSVCLLAFIPKKRFRFLLSPWTHVLSYIRCNEQTGPSPYPVRVPDVHVYVRVYVSIRHDLYGARVLVVHVLDVTSTQAASEASVAGVLAQALGCGALASAHFVGLGVLVLGGALASTQA
jgi:hypothetical protein